MTRTEQRGPARIKCHGNTLACKIAHKIPTMREIRKLELPEKIESPVALHSIARMNKDMDTMMKSDLFKKPKVVKKWWQIWK